jgi:hypothetical protein
MPTLKGLNGEQIAQLIGNILDVVGVGFSARGGVNRQTALQSKNELQRQANAALMQKQGEANIEVGKIQQILPAQLENELKIAHAKGDIDTENAIRQAAGLALIQIKNDKDLAAYTADLDVATKTKLFQKLGIQMGLYTNPGQYGASQAATITPPNP